MPRKTSFESRGWVRHSLFVVDDEPIDYVLQPIDRHRFPYPVERARRRLVHAPGQLIISCARRWPASSRDSIPRASSLVNADRVRELQPMFNGDSVVVLRDGTKVAGSRRYRAAFDMLTR